jgi:transposase-like protein
MEAEWRVWRARLRDVLRDQPEISTQEAARQLGRSAAWVRKWRERLRGAGEDEAVLNGQSRRPKESPNRLALAVEERIVELRLGLSEVFHRVVGPRTILAYLRTLGGEQRWPRSTATIWRVLRRRQLIRSPPPVVRHPVVRPTPGLHWELDYCTIAQQTPDAPDKRQNGLEVLSMVDCGSSAVIATRTRADYDAERSLMVVADILTVYGIPRSITFDRDPRLVGSSSTENFPSALMRFLLCLGCEPVVLPPQKPELKPFIERFQRTFKEECISRYRPTTAATADEVLEPYCEWYNTVRPHQGAGLNLQPPGRFLPHPTIRPRLPEQVDPDAWLHHYDGHYYRRHVDSRGAVQLWKHIYYIGQDYVGQRCALKLEASTRSLHIEVNGKFLKNLPLKGLVGFPILYDDFLGRMIDEARSEWKTYLWNQQLKRIAKFA